MNAAPARADSNRTLFAALVATVTMLFLAFTAAYLERRATMAEWPKLRMPPLVWVNTAILALSSLLLARRRLSLSIALGFLFLALQAALFRSLAAQGVYLPSHPHSSFFHVLTAAHGVHVVGGLIALLAARARPHIRGLCASFWHFLGAVWLYVLLVLQLL